MDLIKKAAFALGSSKTRLFGTAMSLSLLLALPLASPAQVSFADWPLPVAGSAPQGVIVGPDGAIWFTENGPGGASEIGRIDLNGNIKEYPAPGGSRPQQIVAGPDGNLYFTVTNGNYIEQLTPAGVFTQYTIPLASGVTVASPTGITVGHDGNIWFTMASPETNMIGAVSVAGDFTVVPGAPFQIPTNVMVNGVNEGSIPTWITVGPDNNIWFTEQLGNKIGTVRSGAITEYTVPTASAEPFGIVAGPDGNLWFTERNAGKIGKITTSGTITEYALSNAAAEPIGITVGPDGALWFTEAGTGNIGRITTAGTPTPPTDYPIPTASAGPYGIVEGPDHALWFAEDSGNKIGRVSSISFESFAQVDGALTQVSIGADGTVWGINGSQQIFTYNHDAACNVTSGGWTLIGGALTHIEVGSSSAVWGLNQQQQIYHWDCASSSWTQIPGWLEQIAVGADGDVWGLNFQSNVYHYSAKTGLFSQVGTATTQLSSIAVGSAGAVYGLNSAGSIYWYNPGIGAFVWLQGSVGFTDIAVGADGDLWGLKGGVAYHYDVLSNTMDSTGTSLSQLAVGSGAEVFGLNAGGGIFQWDATAANWVQLGGSLASIAAGANGTVWGVNSSQQIFRLLGAPEHGYQTLNTLAGATLDQISVGVDGTAWGVSNLTVQFFNRGTQTFKTVPSPPNISQVSVGASVGNRYSNGADVWAVTGCPNPNQDGSCPEPGDVGIIYRYNASTGTWTQVPGELNLVQVGADGSVWGINAAGSTYTYNFSNNSWTQIPGQLGTLSVGADGDVWGINGQLQVYHLEGSSWVNVPGSLSAISVGDANNVWGVNAYDQVYYYSGNASSPWVNIPGAALDEVWVTFDGAVWGVNASDNLYRWNGSSFNLIGTNVSIVVLGNAVNVWATFPGSQNPTLPATVQSWF